MRKLSFQIYARKYLLDVEKKGKLMNIEHMCIFLGESKEKVKKRFAPTVVFPKKVEKFSSTHATLLFIIILRYVFRLRINISIIEHP